MSQFRGVAGFPGAVVITPMTDVDVPLTITDVNGTTKFTVDKAGVASSGGIKIQTSEPLTYSILAAGSAVNQSGFIADATYQVTGVQAVWATASTSGTVAIEKLTGTTAPGSGTTMQTGTINTAGTANTVTAGTLVGTASTLQLAVGDRIGLVFSGTQTNLVGLVVMVFLKRI